jgi:hypothetical protein
MRNYEPNETLISLHVPKCAGQSFRLVLEKWYKENFYIHYFQQYNRLPRKHDLKPGICIHGHFNRRKGFGTEDYYPMARQFITVLRDPLEMAISNYFFWKKRARKKQLDLGVLKQESEDDYKNIDDFFVKRPKSNLLDFLPEGLNEENFKQFFEEKFVWIGVVDRLLEGVSILSERLGFNKPDLHHINVSERDEELSSSLAREFLSNNWFEFKIYSYVNEYCAAY